MERWEPPVAPPSRGRWRRRQRRGSDLPAALEAAGGRILTAFLFIIAGLSRTPPIWLPVAGSCLIVGLLLLGGVFGERFSRTSRFLWLADAATLGLLIPLLLFNTFAGSGEVPLSAQERSVYLQSAAALALACVALWAGLIWYARSERSLVAIGLLPAALSIPAIAGAHDDLRTSVVAAALVISWLVAAGVSIAAAWLGNGLGRVLPGAAYLAFALLTLAADPRLASLGGHGLPVALVEPLLLLLAAVLLFLPALPAAPSAPRRRRRRR